MRFGHMMFASMDHTRIAISTSVVWDIMIKVCYFDKSYFNKLYFQKISEWDVVSNALLKIVIY